jgi:7-hydroxymethyl chlorophyll a reductase
MSRAEQLEREVHGRSRDMDNDDELHLGVALETLYAANTPPVVGAQWTGLVTSLAVEALRSGLVEAVVCVQSDPDDK